MGMAMCLGDGMGYWTVEGHQLCFWELLDKLLSLFFKQICVVVVYLMVYGGDSGKDSDGGCSDDGNGCDSIDSGSDIYCS